MKRERLDQIVRGRVDRRLGSRPRRGEVSFLLGHRHSIPLTNRNDLASRYKQPAGVSRRATSR